MNPDQLFHFLRIVKHFNQKDKRKRPLSPAQHLIWTLQYILSDYYASNISIEIIIFSYLSEECSMQALAWCT